MSGKKWSLTYRWTVIGVTAAVAAIVCVASPNLAARAADKPELTLGITTAGTSLDPAKDNYGVETGMRMLAYEPLIKMKPDGTFAPGLALSWRYFDSGQGPNKGFELVLRQNARFSDGSQVTAPAVVASLTYFASANGPFSTLLGPNPAFSAVGKWKVQVRMKSPNPLMPAMFSELYNWGFIIGPRGLADRPSLGTTTDGAGPYQVDSSQSITNDHYTLVPNANYYAKSAVKWSKVHIKVIIAPASMLEALRAGQLDAAIGAPATVSSARSSGLAIYAARDENTVLLLMDRAGKPLGDLRVRQALSYAFDRKAICSAAYGSYANTTAEYATVDGTDPALRNYYGYDPAKAKSLLASAGYPNGFSISVLGSPFPVIAPAVGPVAQYLGNVGVHVNITSPVTGPEVTQKLTSGSYSTAVLGGFVDPSLVAVPTLFSPQGLENPFHVSDPTINKLYVNALHASNPPAVWRQLWKYVTQRAYVVPLCVHSHFLYATSHVGGIQFTGVRGHVIPFVTEWFPK